MRFQRLAALLYTAVALAHAACSSPPTPPPQPEKPAALGAVQHEIKVGMDQAAVREALGAPRIVSSDSQHREVWTYDQIPSDRIDTSRSIGGGLIVLGGGKSSLSDVPSESERALTIIIYFDEQRKVRDLAYNYSSL